MKPVVKKPPTYCLYRVTGEPEKGVGKQKLGKIDAEYKIFFAEELDAARLRGWFSAAAVIEAAERFKAEPIAEPVKTEKHPFPCADKSVLAEWAQKNVGLTLDKRKTLESLIAEVAAAYKVDAHANSD